MAGSFTLGQKLAVGFGSVIVLTVVLAFSSVAAIGRLGSVLNTSLASANEESNLTDDIERGVWAMKEYAKMTQFAYSVNGMLDKKSAESCTACHSLPDREEARRGFAELASKVHANATKLRAEMGDVGGAEITAIDQNTDQWSTSFERFLAQAAGGHFEAAHSVITDEMEPIRERIEKASTALQKAQDRSVAEVQQDSAGQVSRARALALGLVAVSVLLGIVVALVIRNVNRTLRGVVERLARNSSQVADQAAEIASASQEVAQGSVRQASSVEQIRQAGDSLNSTARANAEETQAMARFVGEIHEGVDQANGTLNEGLEAMRRIDESSGQIARIIKVIDEIAFQTNLLALNAAVEAARAGEAGLGFAVVAEEVRDLAQRCARAAKETATLIGESIERSKDGRKQLNALAGDIQAIVERTRNLEEAVRQLSQTSSHQTTSVESIARTLTEVDTVITQSASSAEQTAGSSEQLSSSAADLNDDIHTLARLVG